MPGEFCLGYAKTTNTGSLKLLLERSRNFF